MSSALNNRIRVFRAEHRFSQSDLAERIGVTRKTISTIEVGRFVPSTVIALKIARCFGVPLEDIFSLNDAAAENRSAPTADTQGEPP
jgi:putative transcriptional regulator